MSLRILIVVGTRPEVIKMAPVYEKLSEMDVEVHLLATAQHREMMDMMLDVFGMKPDYDLNIMKRNQSLNYVASEVLRKMEGVLLELAPDVVLVQGDTTTAMASAVAAFHLGLKIGHVEAGLRSHSLAEPFPEEMNRRVIDVLSSYAFAPTVRAAENLLREGVDESRVYIVGNTVVDALNRISLSYDLPSIRYSLVGDSRYILVTLHRRENFGGRMVSVLEALKEFSDETGLDIVFPVHRNPRVRAVVHDVLGGFEKARLMDPMPYVEFLALLQGCEFVLTDSGGIQEEAPSFEKFVVVARNTTERPELVESGWGVLAGTEKEDVLRELRKAIHFKSEGRKNPFGDGMASKRIVNIILEGEYKPFEG